MFDIEFFSKKMAGISTRMEADSTSSVEVILNICAPIPMDLLCYIAHLEPENSVVFYTHGGPKMSFLNANTSTAVPIHSGTEILKLLINTSMFEHLGPFCFFNLANWSNDGPYSDFFRNTEWNEYECDFQAKFVKINNLRKVFKCMIHAIETLNELSH